MGTSEDIGASGARTAREHLLSQHAENRRRRPSGEPPPLPRDLGRSGRFWLIMVGYLISVAIGVIVFAPFQRLFEHWDTERLRWVVALRTRAEIPWWGLCEHQSPRGRALRGREGGNDSMLRGAGNVGRARYELRVAGPKLAAQL